jgi:CpcD/allophycocyanin linker domain
MSDCIVKIDVTNMSSHSTVRSGSYSIKVPFSSLSRTMQFIHRSGGKVIKVTKLSAIDTLANLPQIETPVYTSTTRVDPQSSSTTTVVRDEQKPTQTQSKRGGKNKR